MNSTAEIRDLFPALVQIEHLKPVAGDLTGAIVSETNPADGPIPERLGEYRILRQVGYGGMGVVYEAEQETLGHHVALKVLPRQALLKTTYLERFRREAKAARKAPPRKLDPHIPRDLETVVLKCLAEDVRRFLAERPILARRSTWRERTWRWCRRNPVIASLRAALLLVLTVTALGGVIMSIRLGESLQEAREAQREGKRKLFESYVSEADAVRVSRRQGSGRP